MICDLCNSRSAVALFDTRMCCVDVGSGYLPSAGPPMLPQRSPLSFAEKRGAAC